MAAKQTEEQKKAAQLLARRNRRARKAAEKNRGNAALVAENTHSDAVAEAAENDIDHSAAILDVTQQMLAGARQPRRITEARENLSLAFDLLGGVPMLVVWGRKNPTEFFRIWARLIPKEAAQEASEKLPLETLLAKLSERADMAVSEAAIEIGEEALAQAAKDTLMEDAMAAFNGVKH